MPAENTATKLPQDKDSATIQVLEPAAAVYLTTGGASSRVALPSGAEIVLIGASEACWLTFGDSGVVAAASTTPAILMPGGMIVLQVPAGATHIAGIQVSTGGPVSISRLV